MSHRSYDPRSNERPVRREVHPIEFGRKVVLPESERNMDPICTGSVCRVGRFYSHGCESTCRLTCRPDKTEPAWPKPPRT